MKRPDEFVTGSWQLIEWVQENSRLATQVGIGVAVAVLAVVGLWSMRGARVRQANADLAAALGQYKPGSYPQAATQLADMSTRWENTSAARAGRLFAASANLRSGNLDGALAVLEAAGDTKDWPPYLRQQALVATATALERKGDTAGAATRYAEAGGTEGPYVATAILGEARCREAAGQKDEARKLYERFVQEFPDAAENALAKGKLDSLKG